MLPLLAESSAPAIAMHTLGPPKSMQKHPYYEDVVGEIEAYLVERVRAAERAGVDPARVAIDPGIGFGKRIEDNLALLRDIDRFVALGHPVLIGTSNKSFLGRLTGKDVDDRLMATAASVAIAIAKGAHIIRVHEVAALADVVAVADAIARGRPAPTRA
jgi:dihydropteroate synthase